MTTESSSLHGEAPERQEFRAAIRSLLDKTWSAQDARSFAEGSFDTFDKVNATLRRDMSLGGILVPDELGGLGGGLADAAVAAEELGAALFPHDLLGSWIASDALLRGDGDGGADVLGLLTSEETPFAFAWPGQDPTWRLDAITPALLTDDGVTGTCSFVPGGRSEATVVLPVSRSQGVGLAVVPASAAAGVTWSSRVSSDLLRPISDVALENAAATVLDVKNPEDVFTHAVVVGAVLLAAEAAGAARACLDATVGYGTVREQFGRNLVSFQVVKHRLGTVLIEVERARASVYRAAAKADEGREGEALQEVVMLARIAKTAATRALHLAARESVQIHGAMGFTWENPSHLYLRRWAVTGALFGKNEEHYELLYDDAQTGRR